MVSQSDRHPGRRRFEWLELVLLAVAWIALWRLSGLMEYAPHASIWFPPAGLTLASFLVLGWRAAPVIALCGVVVTFWANAIFEEGWSIPLTLLAGSLFALAHGGAFAIGATLLRLMQRHDRDISLPAQVIIFLLVASLSALLAAYLGIQALLVSGAITAADSVGLWVPWWIGDMAGAVALTPLFAGLLGPRRPHRVGRFPVIERTLSPSGYSQWLFKLLVLLSLLCLAMVLTALSDRGELLAFAVFFLIIPQMWITYTESAFRVALSLTAFSTLIAVSVAGLGLDEHAMVYQFAITVIAASTWFGLTVSTLVEQNRRLRELADADELTGATGRRHFFERARDEQVLARRRARPVSLVLFDIDRFKQINDSYGHSRGDRALVEVAHTVRQNLRQDDLFGRFGGDEFMLLMIGCDGARAAERAEELRLGLHEVRNDQTGEALSGTFSVVDLDPAETIAEAFERADTALLEAKRAGRDRVVYQPGPNSPV